MSTKAFSVVVVEETETATDMAGVLRTIAGLIEQGYTSGYYPTWQLEAGATR